MSRLPLDTLIRTRDNALFKSLRRITGQKFNG